MSYCPHCQKYLPPKWGKDVWFDRFRCSCGALIKTVISPWWLPLIGAVWSVILPTYVLDSEMERWLRILIAGLSSAAVVGLSHALVFRPRLVGNG